MDSNEDCVIVANPQPTVDSVWRARQNETMFEVGDSSHENIQRSANIEVDNDENNDTHHSDDLRNRINIDDENDGSGNAVYPQFNKNVGFGHVSFECGMTFSTIEEFKFAIKDFTIHLGKEIKWLKNEPLRARAICKNKECHWKIFCSRNEKLKCFQIKTYFPNHTCSTASRNEQGAIKNKQANRKWDAKVLQAVLRDKPEIEHQKIFDLLERGYRVTIDRDMIFRATKDARKLIEGSERKQYELTPELIRSNTSSTVKINTIPSKVKGATRRPKKQRRKEMNEEYDEQQVRKNMVVAEEIVQEQAVIAGNTVEHIHDHGTGCLYFGCLVTLL